MAEDGKIIYKITLDDGDVEQKAAAAGQKGANRFEEVMTGAARRIGEAFVEMAAKAIKGVEQIAQAGIEFNAKMEKYQTGLTTLLGNEQEAAAVMEQIRADAARTPFDVDSLTQANQMLISTGMSAGDARNDVLNLANAIAATGGGSAELSRMAANMQQVKNVGKATAMDIRQFAMAGINIYKLLADATGKTTEEVKDMEVSYEALSAALAKAAAEGGAYEGAMEAQSQTFNGRLSTLKDNVLQLEGALTQDLFTQLSETALPMVMDWVAQLLEAAETGGIEGAIQAAEQIISKLIETALEKLPQLVETGMNMLVALLNGIGDSLPIIVPVVVAVISTIITGVLNHLPEIIDAGMHILLGLIQGITDVLPQLIDMIPMIISTIVDVLAQHYPEIMDAGMQILFAIGKGMIQALPHLLTIVPQIEKSIIYSFRNADWESIGQNIVGGVWSGINSMWDTLVARVTQAVSELWSSAKSALGIASPSKKFKYIGEMSVEGIEEGFEDGETDLEQTVHHVYESMLNTPDISSDPFGFETFERNVSFNLLGKMSDLRIEVPVILNDREIARATAWSMGEQLAWEEL